MKTINSFRSKLLALTLALMASVSSFAYDYHGDLLCYNVLTDSTVAVTGQSEYKTMPRYEYLPENLAIPAEVTLQGKAYKVVSIDQWAFYACTMLKSVTIPSSVTFIGKSAFHYCENLVYVDIPTSVTTVEGSAFSYTKWYDNLPDGEVYINNTLYRYKGTAPENTQIVVKDGTTRIAGYTFWNQSNIVSIELPQTLTVIEHDVFEGCTQLSSILIPKNVTDIGASAFADCTGLTEVICLAPTPPTMGQYANPSADSEIFARVDVSNTTLYVPAESVEAYKNVDQWKDFGQILPIEPTTSYKSQWCDTWNMLVRTSSIYPPSPYRYQLAKDTVIGEHTYTAVVQKVINDALMHLGTWYVAAVRFTDDRKVYIYYDNAEYLLYDFNVQQGDELEVFAGINNYTSEIKTYKCTVTGVEQYACVGCPAAITLEVHNHPNDFREFYRETQWIEGVGDINGFLNGINHYVEMDGGGSEYLLCAYQGDELKYTGDLYEEYGCGDDAEQSPEDLFPTLWGLQRTSCTKTIGEDEEGTVHGLRSTLMKVKQDMIIDGKQYVLFGDGQNYNSFLLREKGNKVFVYSSLLRKDLVLYDYTLEVGDSLPALYIDWQYHDAFHSPLPYNGEVVDYNKDYDGTILPADTFIVTNISTITLLDGKEHKKWTFNNGMQYVEGIGSYRTSYAENDFYQLIANVPQYSDADSTFLVCVSRNGQLLYQMDDAAMERLGAECLCEVETSYKSQWCNTWNVFTHSGGARLDSEETWQYKLDRDTIINGKLYSTVIYYLTSDPSREYYMGAVRFGDDRKVYRAIGNSESVVYDFTAQVGDTLGPGVVYDVEVDSLTNLKTIYFHPYDRYEDKYIEYATVEWIEGVGSTDGFLLAKDYGTVGGASFYLLCAYRDDELKYAANKELGCRYNAGEVTYEHFPTLAGLSRTIHEERSTNDTTRRDDFTKVVLDLKFPTLYHSQMYLRERDNKIFVVSRTYKNLTELYEYVLYDFTLEVGDSLPMLYIDYSSRGNWGPTYPLSILNVVNYRKEADGTIYPGDTLVVTEVSTITLLDGKEYKKWTFNNGMEYAEGIGSLSGDFYELIANKRTTEDLTASQLVCASQNGQLLYQMDDAEMERLGVECLCEYNSGPKKDNAKNGKIGGRPTPTQWNMLEFETKEVDGTPTITRAETFSYTLENDSIVTKGKTFYQLARQSTKDTAITKSFVGALHFGEDEDNRVYFLRDGVEYVLYDFTAEPGDTIEIFAGINNYPQYTTYTHVVTGKDTLENGACRMILEVVFPEEIGSDLEQQHLQKVWLAGLGSIDGIVHNAASRATKARSSETQTSVMLCAWRDDNCLYTTDHPDYDSYGCVYNLPTSIKDIETSGGKCQKLLRDGHLYILRDNKLYDVLGTPLN